MEKQSKIFAYALFTISIVALFLNIVCWCNPRPNPMQVTVKKEVHNYYDSTEKTIVPQILPTQTTFSFVPVPQNVDTAAILRQFFGVYTYTQNIEDTMIKAVLSDTISENKIRGRSFTYKLVKPIRTVESTTVTNTVYNKGLFVGAFATVGKSALGCFGPQAGYQFKSGKQINLGYDFVNKGLFLSAQFRIDARADSKIK